MTPDPRNARFMHLFLIPVFFVLGLAFVAIGCGSSEESMDEWETTPAVSQTGSIDYKVDSLKNETRKMKEQLDAMAAENRSLTARNAELETKLAESATAPKPAIAPAPSRTAGPVSDVSAAYGAALEQYRKRNFADAAQQFESILSAGAGDKLADNCHYWIGESYYGMKKYNDAIKQFETVLGYKGSGKRAYAQLMIGNSYSMLGDKAAAKEAYNKVVNDYPLSEVVEKAKAKIEKMK